MSIAPRELHKARAERLAQLFGGNSLTAARQEVICAQMLAEWDAGLRPRGICEINEELSRTTKPEPK